MLQRGYYESLRKIVLVLFPLIYWIYQYGFWNYLIDRDCLRPKLFKFIQNVESNSESWSSAVADTVSFPFGQVT
jgi:hypothetical protein